MNSSADVSIESNAPPSHGTAKLYLEAFWGLLLRDFRVLRRELGHSPSASS